MAKDSPSKKAAQTPRLAATVVLMRPCDGVPFEIFMVRRHDKSHFMANAFVFPGGSLSEREEEGCSRLLERHCRGYQAEVLKEQLGVEEEIAAGLFVTALRELFEEAGALLASEGDGQAINFSDDAEKDRYETYREALIENEVDFDQIIEWEDLLLSDDSLTYFAHWITPEISPIRFDTHFFLARAPEGQVLTHDKVETVEGRWITPKRALELYKNGKFELPLPTLCTLEKLRSFHSIDEAITYFQDRPIPTVMPHFTQIEDRPTILLPGDPEYPHPVEVAVEGPTRLMMSEGKWWSVDPNQTDVTYH